MAEPRLSQLLDGKDEGARCAIAHRVGERLAATDISGIDRRAAETLAQALTADAIERVRRALSEAVRHAPRLPKYIALKIAHDVDSVAVPFLEITEVFSGSDWQKLVLTLSRGALVAVSGRSSMPESLALRLAELGDSVIAVSLVENPATPMTEPVCHTVIERFEAEMWVLDKLADRGDMIADIAAALTLKVSRLAREKLMQTYDLEQNSVTVGTVMSNAEIASLVELVAKTDSDNMVALARRVKREHKLTPRLTQAALHSGALEFCEAALSLLSESRFGHARSVTQRADAASVVRLLAEPGVSEMSQDEFWAEVEAARPHQKPD